MQNEKGTVKYWLTLGFGLLLLTVGVYFFKTPNGFATGGVSGLSILLARLLPMFTQAEYMAAINVLLLIVGTAVLGRECGGMTVLCSLLFSAGNWALERFLPLSGTLTDQPFLELVYAILLTGIGSAILFNCSASSGGTDIVALILKKYSSLDVGRALLASDALIAFSGFFITGVQAGLYSVLGLFAKAFLIDTVVESMNICKAFTIITTKPREIGDFIIRELHHGVTAHGATGVYTGEEKTVLLTICRRTDAARLKREAKRLDPGAFIIVANSSEIVGRGFREV